MQFTKQYIIYIYIINENQSQINNIQQVNYTTTTHQSFFNIIHMAPSVKVLY